MSALPPLLLVGGGRMGGAMLAGWREQGVEAVVLVDPAEAARAHAGGPVAVVADAAAIPATFRPAAVVLAVKPQMADAALPAVAARAADAVVVSIMAGRTIANVAARIGRDAVIRAMPNTPAAIRQGITVAVAAPSVADRDRALADRLLQAIGTVAWVEDEALLDPVTALSGGGPAYVFLLAELLEREGLRHGLPADLARLLARRTVAGAGALLAADPTDAARLREAVTSPGGTTERALGVLMRDDAWPDAMTRAIAAATERSRALAG